MSETVPSKFIGTVFPADVAKALRLAAVQNDQTLSAFIRDAAIAHLDRQKERERERAGAS